MIAGSLIAWVEEDLAPSIDAVARIRVRALDATGAPTGEAFTAGIATRGSGVAVAAAGSTHLVVWETPEHRIAGAHIDPIRRPGETPQPFEISPGPLDNAPDVATDGEDFVVLWQRDRYEGISCVLGCTPPRSIRAAKVTSWGVVGGAPIEIAERGSLAAPPMLAWDGSGYAVFWSRWDDLSLRVRHLHRSGTPLGEEQRVDVRGVLLAVTWTGSEYLLASSAWNWERIRITVTRVDRELGVLQKLPVPADVVVDSGVAVIDELGCLQCGHVACGGAASRGRPPGFAAPQCPLIPAHRIDGAPYAARLDHYVAL
ncbi:MAG: hypothetical protein ACXW5U_09055 [Thermoanaerobaculia bacterium]